MEAFFKRPWVIVAVITVITLFFASFLPQVELDNNNLRFVPDDDPALETSRWIEESFGSSLFILVGLRREYGTVFDSGFLNRIRDYVEEVKSVSIVKEIVSLVSADYITSIDGAITVEPLVRGDFSGTPQEIAELKRRLLSWDLYERAMVSDDFTATQILIPLTISQEEAGLPEISEKFLAVRDLAHEMFDDLCSVYVTGMPVIVASINEEMTSDLKLLVPLVVVVVLVVLFISFRKFSRVVLPLLTVVIAVIWSVGAMPLFGFKLSVISTVLPVILVAVGSAYGIHVVTHYLTDRGDAQFSGDEHKLFVLKVLRKIIKPVFLAALTTFAGFFSLCFTPVHPIREFGYFSSFGVLAAFIVAVTFIPSLLIIRGPEKKKDGEKEDIYSSVVADTLMVAARKKRTVLSLAVLVVLFSVYGLTKIVSDNAMIEYFKPDTEVSKSDKFIRENFGGSKVINVVLHGESAEIILHPATLSAMDSLGAYLESHPNVGKLMGFTDMVKRINQVINADADPNGLERTEETDSFDDFGFGFGFDSGFGFDFEESEVTINDFSEPEHSPSSAEERIFTQEEFFAILDRASSASRELSANDLVKELKRQVNYEGAAYYEIPADPARYGKDTPEDLQRLVSNYLVLLSGGISNYANDDLEPTAIKTTVQLRTVGMGDSQEIFDAIDRYLFAHVPDGVNVTIGGATMVEGSLNNLVVRSQIISVIISIFCVFIIIAVSNRSLIAGIVGVAPLSISILVNFAVMGLTGIKLNLGTSMVASVSVGIGIDYSIHFLEAFKREYRKYSGGVDFLRHSFNSSGKAIIINAVSVGAGFAVLMLSRFNMLVDLGLLIAITMFTSALVSLTVLPVLLTVLKPKFIYA
ncbi:MAG: MMPL family transporter [Treponema sp.]|jgi:predicted RND superfamily exporter protein|nr:MMPL family transporter [Treponema sp.]